MFIKCYPKDITTQTYLFGLLLAEQEKWSCVYM